MRVKKLFFLFLSIIMLITQTSCWQGREIDARAFVTAIAFDLPQEQAEGVQQFLLSIQVPVPLKMAGGERGGSPEEKPFLVFGTTADTVIAGILQLQRQLDRQLFLGHARLILISEEVVKVFGLDELLDYFKRDFRIQRMTRIAIVEGKAKEVLNIQPPIGQTPSTYILNLISPQSGSSFNYISDLGKLLVTQSDEGIEPVLPRISKGKETALTGGAAVLKNGKFLGWLSDFETRGLNILLNEFIESDYQVECPLHSGEIISVGVNNLRTNYRLAQEGNTWALMIKVGGKFETREFSEKHGPMAKLTEGLERNVTGKIREELEKVIIKAQGLGADIFGIGRYLQAYNPKLWKQLNWEQEFPYFPIKLEVKMEWGLTVRRLGG